MRSIFNEYFKETDLVDRNSGGSDPSAVDVVIPVFNTNPMWEKNLLSIYREIPVNSLIIGDGGCTDGSVEIAKKFPRVKVLDHSKFNSLGFSLRKMFEEVRTEWFVYLHSDVYLPEGWFDAMAANKGSYDWFESGRRMTIVYEYIEEGQEKAARAYSGSQMGRAEIMKRAVASIDDDYLYRNEDIIIAGLLEKAGGRYGRTTDTFHYHQIMNKNGEKEPKLKAVSIKREENRDWEIRTLDMQARGLIKYLEPKRYLAESVNAPLRLLKRMGALDEKAFFDWVRTTNPGWRKYIMLDNSLRGRLLGRLRRLFIK